MKFSILPGLAIVMAILASGVASAEWQADQADKLELKAETAVAAFKARVPRSNAYFDDAYGYAIYPSVTRIGFGFGGAYGKGIVIAGDDSIGTSSYKQFTSGIQAGARNFSMIVFFKDEQALEYFQLGKTQFMGQAGVAVGTFGAAGTPAYNEGVAVLTLTRLGLMGEFTVSGAKFSFRPAPKP